MCLKSTLRPERVLGMAGLPVSTGGRACGSSSDIASEAVDHFVKRSRPDDQCLTAIGSLSVGECAGFARRGPIALSRKRGELYEIDIFSETQRAFAEQRYIVLRGTLTANS